MPTNITAHIVNVKKTSAARHGASMTNPISAIAAPVSADDDIRPSR
jgi:hypothetical protein